MVLTNGPHQLNQSWQPAGSRSVVGLARFNSRFSRRDTDDL